MKNRPLLILISLIVAGSAPAEEPPQPGSFYPLGELGIEKTDVIGTQIVLTFKPKAEPFYWCPGAKVQTVKQGTAVTFIRCSVRKTCAVDAKAAIGKRLIRTIKIDTRGKNTYIRTGPKEFKLIYKAPPKPTKQVRPKPTAEPVAAPKNTDSTGPAPALTVINSYAVPTR